MVHGADLARSLLREGLLDEVQIHLVPVLLGHGRRLFDHLKHTDLEAVQGRLERLDPGRWARR